MVKKGRNTRYRGVSIVEFALVLPLLLMLTLGAIRYGYLFLKAQQITNAARQGARIACRPDGPTTDDGVRAVVAPLISQARINIDHCDVTLTLNNNPEPEGDSVAVRITVPAANVDIMHVPLFTDLEPDDWKLGATVTMAKEGF
jgi:Flp pilus assembly protein TadG